MGRILGRDLCRQAAWHRRRLLPVPDGAARLCGIVGGYRLMEGRTVAATGNGCADRRGASVAVLIRFVCGALFH